MRKIKGSVFFRVPFIRSLFVARVPTSRTIIACDHLKNEYVWSDGTRTQCSPLRDEDKMQWDDKYDYRFWARSDLLLSLTGMAEVLLCNRKDQNVYNHCVCEDCTRPTGWTPYYGLTLI
jgi:hypothetical protein